MFSNYRKPKKVVSGLRTRYNPHSRIGQGLITLSPWIDIILIVIFYALLYQNFLIQPGVVIDIPKAPITGGSTPGMTIFVLSSETETPGFNKERIIFDHVEYQPDNPEHIEILSTELSRKGKQYPQVPLILQADRNVSHGTLMQLYKIAKEADIIQINQATRVIQNIDAVVF